MSRPARRVRRVSKNPYPDDFDAKRVARFLLYEKARQLFASSVEPKGWAVVLAGHEAAEIGVLRDLLRWNPRRVLFVDHIPEGLDQVRELWPQAQTFQGDIRDVLPTLRGGIGLANLDFMGYLRTDVMESVGQVGSRLNPGAFVAYTFSRGRENTQARRYMEILETSAQEYLLSYPDLIDEVVTDDHVRAIGYTHEVWRLLNRISTYHAGIILYKREVGIAMGSTSFHHLPARLQNSTWRTTLKKNPSIRISGKEAPELLLQLRESLAYRIGSGRASSVLHL